MAAGLEEYPMGFDPDNFVFNYYNTAGLVPYELLRGTLSSIVAMQCSRGGIVRPLTVVPARPSVYSSHRKYSISSRNGTMCRASGGMGDFFNRKKNDQEAAQKALQDAFKDKKDPWALDEERARKRGGGNGGGGNGGGGGRGGGGFSFDAWGDGFMRWLKGTFKALAAALCFFAFIIAFTFWGPLLQLATSIVRAILRLDARKEQVAATPAAAPDLTSQEELGNVEEAVINQWAGQEHPDVGISEDEDNDE